MVAIARTATLRILRLRCPVCLAELEVTVIGDRDLKPEKWIEGLTPDERRFVHDEHAR